MVPFPSGKYKHTYGGNKSSASNEGSNLSSREPASNRIVPHLKKSSIEENAKLVKDKYGLDEHGYFGEATRTRARIYRSENPIDDSIDFYKNISSGGVEEELTNGRGVKSTLDDGTVITHRIVTSTPDSPAVDINIESPAFIKPQKIHFVYERK